MKELLRSNDPVLISWVEALLSDARIGAVVLDQHTALAEGSIGAIQRRVMVADEAYPQAKELLEASRRQFDGAASVTEDRLLGGRVTFRQPATGYRAAIDPILLAAAIPARGDSLAAVDLGCGAGAAALCLAWRLPRWHVSALDRDPGVAALAGANAAANGFQGRLSVAVGDVAAPPYRPETFDEAIANPPYLDPARAAPTADPAKAAATVESGAGLRRWVDTALRLVRPKGAVTVIQRADRLADLLAALGDRAGEIVVLPLWPKRGFVASRVIVRARKGVRTPLRLLPGLVLHEDDGRFTPEADAVLRFGRALAL